MKITITDKDGKGSKNSTREIKIESPIFDLVTRLLTYALDRMDAEVRADYGSKNVKTRK